MALEPTPKEQELLAEAMQREESAMTFREALAGGVAGAVFVAVAVALLLYRPPSSFAVWPALACWVMFVLASRVTFDTPSGFTVLTQLAFVPLAFSLPAALIPLAVAVGLAAAKLPNALSGRLPVSRLLQSAGNAWFSIGPAAVLVLSGTEARHAGPWLLLGALLAEFLGDFVVSSARFSFSWQTTFGMQLSELWVYGIDAALSGIGLVVAEQAVHRAVAVLAVLPLLGIFALLADERRRRLEKLIELNTAYRGTALVLGDVVEADDGYTGEHSRGVVALCMSLADQLQLDADRRRNLEFAALLHDVGKIAVPKSIVNKPGKLSAEEWTVIKTHTVEGQRMLDQVGGFMKEVGRIVRSHHERWDGTGYPDGLAGEQIPLEARIVSCCDTWNAMRTDRAYRRALSCEVATAELRGCAGTQLDPSLVDALLAVVESEHERAAPRPSPVSQVLVDPTARVK